MSARALALGGMTAMIATALACGSSDAPACHATEATCPTTKAPTWSADVQPIVQTHCVPCHSPGGEEPSPDFTTYQGLDHVESTAFSQVLSCAMPPVDAPSPLGDADRQTLLTWFACGAPNN